jgi:hypothetical protein
MEVGIALKYSLGSTMLVLGRTGTMVYSQPGFLGQTFHGLAIQISDGINLPYSFSTVCTGSPLNRFGMYDLGSVFPQGGHDFECLRSPARLTRYCGSVGFGGILNTAYRLCKVFLGQHTPSRKASLP